jgi:hypothetical protein
MKMKKVTFNEALMGIEEYIHSRNLSTPTKIHPNNSLMYVAKSKIAPFTEFPNVLPLSSCRASNYNQMQINQMQSQQSPRITFNGIKNERFLSTPSLTSKRPSNNEFSPFVKNYGNSKPKVSNGTSVPCAVHLGSIGNPHAQQNATEVTQCAKNLETIAQSQRSQTSKSKCETENDKHGGLAKKLNTKKM